MTENLINSESVNCGYFYEFIDIKCCLNKLILVHDEIFWTSWCKISVGKFVDKYDLKYFKPSYQLDSIQENMFIYVSESKQFDTFSL